MLKSSLAGAKVENSDNYTLTLDTEALSQKQAIITIEKKPAQQSLLTRLFGVRSAAEYDYVSELGNLIINIPADAKEGYKLKYTVTQGTYTIDDTTTYTFSGTEQGMSRSQRAIRSAVSRLLPECLPIW